MRKATGKVLFCERRNGQETKTLMVFNIQRCLYWRTFYLIYSTPHYHTSSHKFSRACQRCPTWPLHSHVVTYNHTLSYIVACCHTLPINLRYVRIPIQFHKILRAQYIRTHALLMFLPSKHDMEQKYFITLALEF